MAEAESPAPEPRVSVVVPVYRNVEHIAGCVASIAAQQLAPYELILVDDRGGDGAVAVGVAEAARHGIEVKVVEMPQNGGISAARNAGTRIATGDLIWFCDADDGADPTFLSTLAALIEADDSSFAISRTLLVGGDEPIIEEPLPPPGPVSGRVVADALLRDEIKGYASNKLFRRSLVEAEPFVDEILYYDDYRSTLARALASPRVSLCPDALCHYRWHPSGVSRSFSPATMDLLTQEKHVTVMLERHRIALRERLRYRYGNVVLPLANMAARDPERSPAAREALATAAARVRLRDVPGLLATGAFRIAAAVAVLGVSTGLYRTILLRR